MTRKDIVPRTRSGIARRTLNAPTARQIELAIRLLALVFAAIGGPALAIVAAATGRPHLVLGSLGTSAPLAVARLIPAPGPPATSTQTRELGRPIES